MPKTQFEIIQRRSSCRSFNGRPISAEDRAELQTRLEQSLANPFGAQVRLPLLESDKLAGHKLGTYGVIRGAQLYVAGIVKAGPMDMEGLGYSMERAVLHAAELGLGTCWLAGTYNRTDFKDAAKLAEDERILCVSPVGYAAERRTLLDSMMRGVISAARRKPWSELFYDESFSAPLAEQSAGEWRGALEAVRLAPSASNGQPWRIVKQGDQFHFFRYTGHGDISRVDMGIAACHFELLAREQELHGSWASANPGLEPGNGLVYFKTWNIAAE